jgi:hypothetical protein
MDIHTSVSMITYLQYNFDKNMCNIIFENDSCHFFEKWEKSNNNIIDFLSRLDKQNKHKILDWVLKNTQDT